MRRRVFPALVLALLVSSLPAASSAKNATGENPTCLQFYHSACSEAIGRWLPSFGDLGDRWWRLGQATQIARRDGFVYEGRQVALDGFFGNAGPDDGTFFVYGSAGPPKGRVVYDAVHRIAFYSRGCCSWRDFVLAAGVAPPPKSVVSNDLRGVVTVRGVRLWETPGEVRRRYGPSTLRTVPNAPGVAVLAYTTWRPFRLVRSVSPCGQMENFFFRSGRLVLIQLGNGC